MYLGEAFVGAAAAAHNVLVGDLGLVEEDERGELPLE